jgi:hypothetical protein
MVSELFLFKKKRNRIGHPVGAPHGADYHDYYDKKRFG